ncbi:MAG: tetratricopeptide repeat protein [Lachnospiraceae bacterium]|nr:tetratricopeptide repeat protein [Lachnospiraceae bacterium]
MLTASVLATSLLTGCKIGSSTEKTDEAFALIANLDYEGALATFDEALEKGGDEREILRGKGIAYIGEGRYEEAISALTDALSLSSGIVESMDYDINYYLALAYFKSGNTDEAVNIYDTILSLKPGEVDAVYLRGVLYAEKGMLDEALSSFNQVIAIEPDNYDRIINIYTILATNGYKEKGQEYLKSAIDNGTKKMSNYEKGQISYYLEDYESAKTYLEKAREEEGYEAVLMLGKTYEMLGDNNYAVSVFSSYANSAEPSPEILNEMGLCKMSMSDYEGALVAFEEAIAIPNNNMLQTLKFNEIVCYEHLGQFDRAKSLMETYVKSYPDDENAQTEYMFLKTR